MIKSLLKKEKFYKRLIGNYFDILFLTMFSCFLIKVVFLLVMKLSSKIVIIQLKFLQNKVDLQKTLAQSTNKLVNICVDMQNFLQIFVYKKNVLFT